MKYSKILVAGATGRTGSTVADQSFATATTKTREIPSAQAWFAGGQRVGYDPNARAVVRVQSPPESVLKAGGRCYSRCVVPARISRWLLWVAQGTAAFAKRC
jgi:hypothetical protein